MKKIILITLSLFFCFNTLHAQQTDWTYITSYQKFGDEFSGKAKKLATLKSFVLHSPIMKIQNDTENRTFIFWEISTDAFGIDPSFFTGKADKIKVFYNGKTNEKDAVFFEVSYSQDYKFMFLYPQEDSKFIDLLKKSNLISIQISTTEGTYFIHYDSIGFDEKIIEWEK
jgi:hypothetical protein